MNRTAKTALSIAAAASAAIFTLASVPALAQDDAPPPPDVIATVAPVYYEGHPAYWYNNHWYYRDPHGAWAWYHDEPAFLRDHRGRYPVARYHYERGGFHHR